MRTFLFTIIFFISFCPLYVMAEHQIERRIYLLDVTLSMKGYHDSPNIYNDIINALEVEINSISDPTTEIIVLPFQESVLDHFQQKATANGKIKLIKSIKNLNYKDVTYTNLYNPIVEAKRKYIKSNRRNLLFLLTDGIHNDLRKSPMSSFISELKNWTEYAKVNNAYGYYILLTKEAQPSSDVLQAIDETSRLELLTNTGKLSFITLKMPSNINLNIEDFKKDHFKILLDSDKKIPDGLMIDINCKSNPYFSLNGKYPIIDGACTVDLTLDSSYEDLKNELPEKYIVTLSSDVMNKKEVMKKTGKMILFCGDKTYLKITNKREKILTIEVLDNEK